MFAKGFVLSVCKSSLYFAFIARLIFTINYTAKRSLIFDYCEAVLSSSHYKRSPLICNNCNDFLPQSSHCYKLMISNGFVSKNDLLFLLKSRLHPRFFFSIVVMPQIKLIPTPPGLFILS
jgi:hypothetical protein